MSDASLKLADLLPSRGRIDSAELDFSAGPITPTVLGFVGSKVEEAIDAALEADVLGLVALAWTKVGALKDASAEGLAKGEPRHVYLGKHEIESESKIDVRVEFSQLPGAAKLLAPLTDELSLKLRAKFDSVGLTIENGSIVAVDAGEGAVEAELCYSNKKLLGTTTTPVVWPARYRLAHPVMIGLAPAVRAVQPLESSDKAA